MIMVNRLSNSKKSSNWSDNSLINYLGIKKNLGGFKKIEEVSQRFLVYMVFPW